MASNPLLQLPNMSFYFIVFIYFSICNGSTITDMFIKTGSKGAAFVIISDVPCNATVKKRNIAAKNITRVEIIVKKSLYSLSQKIFDSIASPLLCKSIRTISHNGDISIQLDFNKDNSLTIEYRQKNTKFIVLLSKKGYSDYTWSARSIEDVAPHASLNTVPVDSNATNKKMHGILPDDIRRVVVVSDKVSLREKPVSGRKSKIKEKLRLGIKGNCVRAQGNWLLVQFDENKLFGWIEKNSVKDSADLSMEQWHGINTLNAQLSLKESSIDSDSIQSKSAGSSTIKESVDSQNQQPPVVLESNDEDMLPHNQSVENTAPTTTTLLNSTQKSPNVTPVNYTKNKPEKYLVEKKNEVLAPIYRYKVYGRDPFFPLDSNSQTELNGLPNVEGCSLVGIIYDAKDRIALIESENGSSYSLRENDLVMNGRIIRIKPDHAVFILRQAEYARQFILKLNSKTR